MPFLFYKLEIEGLQIVTPKYFIDDRGIFLESFKKSEFAVNGLPSEFVQENISISKKGVLRGLHYQINPMAQGKLVSVMNGTIFDVAVDLRKGSPTFGKYFSIELNDRESLMFWIPPGFAHGFLSLKDNTKVMYRTTCEYSPALERGILWNDPDIGIHWPTNSVIVSEKDALLPRLMQADFNFMIGDKI